MALHIRQIALVARDLEPAVRALCEGLGVDICHRDPGVATFGLQNALMVLGDTFLEVVSPIRDNTAAGRLLERRAGDGGYMVILQTDRLAEDRKRFQSLGVREVWSIELEDIAAVHLHPKDVGAAIVSFDQPRPPMSWRWAGPAWQAHVRPGRVPSIVGAELQSDDPEALAARWAQVLDLPLRELAGGAHAIDLDRGQLRFVRATDGRGDGLRGVVVKQASDAPQRDVDLCGVTFSFVQ